MPQLLLQKAPLDAQPSECSVDLSRVYGEPIVTASRRFMMQADGFSIEDNWTSLVATSAVSQLLTTADVQQNGSAVILSKNGKRLQIEVVSSDKSSIVIEDFSQPPQAFDAPNPGLKRVSVRSESSTSGSIVLTFQILGAQ